MIDLQAAPAIAEDILALSARLLIVLFALSSIRAPTHEKLTNTNCVCDPVAEIKILFAITLFPLPTNNFMRASK